MVGVGFVGRTGGVRCSKSLKWRTVLVSAVLVVNTHNCTRKPREQSRWFSTQESNVSNNTILEGRQPEQRVVC